MALTDHEVDNLREFIDRGEYPLKPSIEAFRLGINFVVYSMSH
jgi:hypothetical protein